MTNSLHILIVLIFHSCFVKSGGIFDLSVPEHKTIVVSVWKSSEGNIDGGITYQLDYYTPIITMRLKEIQDVLMPLPKDMQAELLYHAASYYIPMDAETELCRNHSATMFHAFLNNDLWALKMVDASSKLSPGFLDGHLMDLGSYRQCLSVEAPHRLFRGQHCIVETTGLLPPEMDFFNPYRFPLPLLRTDIMFSVCVPSSCTAQDVRTHMDFSLNSVNASAILYNSSCSSADPEPLATTDYIAIFVLIVIFTSVVASTVYDNFISHSAESDLLTSFSLALNTERLLSPDNSKDSLPCLNGLRVIAMAWVLLGHRLIHLLTVPNLRLKDVTENLGTLGWAPLQESPLAVEIFFLMSGTLVAYNFLKDRKKGKSFSYFSFFVRRYARLTVVLAFMVLMYGTIIIRFTDGPIWRRIFGMTKENCDQYWWATLLYVSNYANPYQICIPQTWYLTVDFQLHMFSPLLLFPLLTHQTRGFLYTTLAFTATSAAAMVYSLVMELPGAGPIRIDQRRSGDIVPSYVQTQYRAGSFLIGILLGNLLFKIKQQEKTVVLTKTVLRTGWILSVSSIVMSVCGVTYFVGADYKYNAWVDPVYMVLRRYTMSAGIAWVILVCTMGQGGVVNKVLSWNALLPLSRLTYAVYLVHYVLQDIQSLRTKDAITTDIFSVWYLFFADFLFSYITAAALHLAVEAPVNNILYRVFQGKSKRKSIVLSAPDIPSMATVEKTRM